MPNQIKAYFNLFLKYFKAINVSLCQYLILLIQKEKSLFNSKYKTTNMDETFEADFNN